MGRKATRGSQLSTEPNPLAAKAAALMYQKSVNHGNSNGSNLASNKPSTPAPPVSQRRVTKKQESTGPHSENHSSADNLAHLKASGKSSSSNTDIISPSASIQEGMNSALVAAMKVATDSPGLMVSQTTHPTINPIRIPAAGSYPPSGNTELHSQKQHSSSTLSKTLLSTPKPSYPASQKLSSSPCSLASSISNMSDTKLPYSSNHLAIPNPKMKSVTSSSDALLEEPAASRMPTENNSPQLLYSPLVFPSTIPNLSGDLSDAGSTRPSRKPPAQINDDWSDTNSIGSSIASLIRSAPPVSSSMPSNDFKDYEIPAQPLIYPQRRKPPPIDIDSNLSDSESDPEEEISEVEDTGIPKYTIGLQHHYPHTEDHDFRHPHHQHYHPKNSKLKKIFGLKMNRASRSEVSLEHTVQLRSTMRKEKPKRTFNEDKPWKHRTKNNVIVPQEAKRYQGVWAANRGLILHRDEKDGKSKSRHIDPLQAAKISFASQDDEDSSQLMPNIVVRELWRRSRLPEFTLSKIWDLVADSNKNYLRKNEFIVGTWLVDQCLYGKKLPRTIDESVWNSLNHGGVNVKVK
ncbi:Phosphatidylinositol 4,5-bisphosphate levels regulator protein [Komagataella phaffii CBS 7435]|uniref:EH domain-containing protein n=2 Tax=Komagataella phaffii TaxID=460519 RepID=C4QV14_KOMPG|nr:EH domain-containing protein [Komagataella phaffii GS115]AOA61354.1 GQ67_02282T0 [Komagataella phaffii]CAH2445737.1 Phosphatidylinositol 4,5-bisphosphate levels regulator protein [Komagataella phaffii CBS 7435]AOA66433.1 GQ68_02965T0 [Komagataella phaffii GS115]CAY67084.1 EH domain-containing protein [Komagataella phaffii GS115]CCA36197.1 Phosphatidylinositol 4,5-bisphosphate levels regulator protein [Komagataella phaffii CBS 7435]